MFTLSKIKTYLLLLRVTDWVEFFFFLILLLKKNLEKELAFKSAPSPLKKGDKIKA